MPRVIALSTNSAGHAISARKPIDAIAPYASLAPTASTAPPASTPTQAQAALGPSQAAALEIRPGTRVEKLYCGTTAIPTSVGEQVLGLCVTTHAGRVPARVLRRAAAPLDQPDAPGVDDRRGRLARPARRAVDGR